MRIVHPALIGLLGMGMGMAQSPLATAYRLKEAPRMGPLLSEVLRFPTVAGNEKAHLDQQAWVLKVGKGLGFTVREAGKVTEVELPGPAGAPVIGLVVHGDVQPVDDHWTIPPFAGEIRNGIVLGRGAADDKGPLVQALLAMKVLKDSGKPRTHTIRLLVGSDEESNNLDFAEYLKDHKAPDFSLVLDSEFPVVVGEKAWNALTVETNPMERGDGKVAWKVGMRLGAGLAPSIVPDYAVFTLWVGDMPADSNEPFLGILKHLDQKPLPPGIKLHRHADTGHMLLENGPNGPMECVPFGGTTLLIEIHGRAAHAGVNAEGGRNALVALANLLVEDLPEGGAKDLLAFAQLAGQDLKGTGLGLATADPVFGFPTVVPSLLSKYPPAEPGALVCEPLKAAEWGR